jgi:NAD(P)H-dependent FMN reductase
MFSQYREGIQSTHPPTNHPFLLCLIFSQFLEAQRSFLNPAFCFKVSDRSLNSVTLIFMPSTLSDLPPNEPATVRIVHQFVADTTDQIQHASALVIVTPATKESPTLLTSLLKLLPDNAFAKKPVLFFATGGLPGHVAILEHELKQTFFRLGTKTVAARVHIGTGGWLMVGDERPRLSRGAEREIRHAIDSVSASVSVRGAVAHWT